MSPPCQGRSSNVYHRRGKISSVVTVLHIGRIEKSLSTEVIVFPRSIWQGLETFLLSQVGNMWLVPSEYLAASPVKNSAQSSAGVEAGKPS